MRQVDKYTPHSSTFKLRHDRRRALNRKKGTFRFVNVLANGLVFAVLGTTALFALSAGGYSQSTGLPYKVALDRVLPLVGLSAQKITIEGLKNVQAEHVYAAIGLREGSSLIGFDAVSAHRRLSKLDWVAEASVQWMFPNRLHIILKERRPYALWQDRGRFHVIDETGKVIDRLDPKNWTHLPVVAGVGARETAFELVNQLEALPSLKLLVRAAARVADRRWTLYLTNGIKVLLPVADVPKALRLLTELESTHGVLGRNIASIDLRLEDRIALRLSKGASKEMRLKQEVSKYGG